MIYLALVDIKPSVAAYENYAQLEKDHADLLARCSKLLQECDFAWKCQATARAEWQAMFDWTVLLREELKKMGGFIPQPPPPYSVRKIPPRHAEVQADWLEWKERWENEERAQQAKMKITGEHPVRGNVGRGDTSGFGGVKSEGSKRRRTSDEF